MSKEIAVKNQMAELATAELEGSAQVGGYISLAGGIMSIDGEEIADNELECVVVRQAGEHTLYTTPYDPDHIASPDCFAIFDPRAGVIQPHEDSTDMQNEDCNTCPSHAFGSAINGKGRACSVRRRLLVVHSMENLADAEPAMLKVPPTSVRNWTKYASKIAMNYARPIFMVKTKVLLVPHKKFQFEVKFEMVELLDESMFLSIKEYAEGVTPALMAPFETIEEEPVGKLKGKKKAS